MRTRHTATMTPTATAGRGLTRTAWRKVTEVIREMNYATGRLAELNVTVR
jgi:hypothetical protein